MYKNRIKETRNITKKKEIINIAVTVDDNYIKPLVVMLTSLFQTNFDNSFNIYLIHSDLQEINIKRVSNLVHEYGQAIRIIKLDDTLFETATSVAHVTKETFYRLLLTEILPNDVDKVLYLDPDIIINGPITRLYDKRFNGNLAISAQVAADDSRWNNEKKRIGIPIKATYFNAGVMLFNIALMRRSQIFNKDFIIEYVIKNNKHFTEGDQSCLNALLWDKVKILNCNIYNYDTRIYYDMKMGGFIKYLFKYIEEQKKAFKKAIIIHYRGASKPWHDNYTGKMLKIYWNYEAKTEYKRRNYINLRIINYYQNIKETINQTFLDK